MYDELIKDLRENHDKYFARDMQAADAIEELQQYADLYKDLTEKLQEQLRDEKVANVNLTGWLAEEHANKCPHYIRNIQYIGNGSLCDKWECKIASLPKWIPVTERLPENQRPVLVYVPPYTDEEEEYIGYVGMAYYTSSARGGYWCGTDGNVYGAIGMIHEPMAWMPLQEPPKEEI